MEDELQISPQPDLSDDTFPTFPSQDEIIDKGATNDNDSRPKR